MRIAKPLISICIPVHNGQTYLKYAIDSCLSQTYENLEILVSDNASSDGTGNILNSYSDKRLIVHRYETLVPAQKNFNRIINLSNGKYFLLLPHDDTLMDGALQSMVEVLERNQDLSFVIGNTTRINENSDRLAVSGHKSITHTHADALRFILANFSPFQHPLIRRDSLVTTTPYLEFFGNYADAALYTKLACDHGGFGVIDTVVSSVREHGNQGQVHLHKLSRKSFSGAMIHHGTHSYKTLQRRGNENVVILRYIRLVKKIVEEKHYEMADLEDSVAMIFFRNWLGQMKTAVLSGDRYLLFILYRNFLRVMHIIGIGRSLAALTKELNKKLAT